MFTQLCGINSAVECQLPKLKVAGSNPVSRSKQLVVGVRLLSSIQRLERSRKRIVALGRCLLRRHRRFAWQQASRLGGLLVDVVGLVRRRRSNWSLALGERDGLLSGGSGFRRLFSKYGGSPRFLSD
jgi:hypothetical protein